jgi:hypothetical protein
MKVNAKLTRRVYTFRVDNGGRAVEKTIEKATLVGGPDPSTMTDLYVSNEGKKLFGAGAVLEKVEDFASSVTVEFEEDAPAPAARAEGPAKKKRAARKKG